MWLMKRDPSYPMSIIYAKNSMQERVAMWEELKLLGTFIQEPWLLSGDFNIVLSSEDRIGSVVTQAEVEDFKDYTGYLQLTPLKDKGCHCTFCNK